MSNIVVLEANAAGDLTLNRSQVLSIVWVGATTVSDVAILRARNGSRIWEGRATGTDTYIGKVFSGDGVLAKDGLVVETLDSGRLYVDVRAL